MYMSSLGNEDAAHEIGPHGGCMWEWSGQLGFVSGRFCIMKRVRWPPFPWEDVIGLFEQFSDGRESSPVSQGEAGL